ncbi:MAG: T9SS type A sorting domain-containing protein [Flavipsychrobacter sp.]|nr:T9SS type A sorting domain-containing protein [Flavipsychrobacter sp.]
MKKALFSLGTLFALLFAFSTSYGSVITIGGSTPTSYCESGTISVSFSATTTFNSYNNFYLELSDASGSFSSPTTLAINFSSTVSPLSGTIPNYINNITSPGHTIRIRSTSPVYISDTLAIAINGPAAAITNSSNNSACFDSTVTFNVVVTGGGTSPTYKWVRNSNIISGATSSTYTTNLLANRDIVYCLVTGNGTCPATAYSNMDTMTVTTTQNSYVNIAISPTSSSCPGATITCTATPVNGGTSPTYQWVKNGVIIPGATASTYTGTYYFPDTLNCIMISSLPCTVPFTIGRDTWGLPGTQPAVAMPISTSYDTIGISSPIICAGTIDTFYAQYSNNNGYLNATPAFQWQKDGVNIPGATGVQYITSSLVTGDTLACILIISDPRSNCMYPYRSKPIVVQIQPPVTPSISIAATADSICGGTPITFYAHSVNGGNTPGFRWLKNGVNIPGGTDSVYTSSALANNDHISCVITSNASCLSVPSATSTAIPVTVNPPAVPTVSITATPGINITAGTSVTFTAAPVNGGNAPVYQWTLNAIPISGATSASYTTSALANNNIIGLIMTSNMPCVSPATISASPVSVKVTEGISNLGGTIATTDFYPNPNNGTFTIKGAVAVAHSEHEVKVYILNMLGQTIFTDAISLTGNTFSKQLTLPAGTASGMYMMHLTIDGATSSMKFTVNK